MSDGHIPDLMFGHLYKVDVSDPALIDHTLTFYVIEEEWETDYNVSNVRLHLENDDIVVVLERFRHRPNLTRCLSRFGIGIIDPHFLKAL